MLIVVPIQYGGGVNVLTLGLQYEATPVVIGRSQTDHYRRIARNVLAMRTTGAADGVMVSIGRRRPR